MKAIAHISIKSGLAVMLWLFGVVFVIAQPQETLDAYKAYQQQDYTQAAALIDRAIDEKVGASDAMTWHIRGFIYKDIYNKVDQKSAIAESRDVAIASLMRSMELDTKDEYRENNIKSLRYLASSYYNDAVLVMREIDKATIDQSEKYYLKYKEIMLELDPDFDSQERDITFYKALATSNRKIYEKDREGNKDYLYRALDNYQYVLKIDPENYGANYNTAINLYNEGAYGIEQIDAEAKIPALVKIQAESVELFREALPYMLKAHELDSTRRETLIGLRGIYLSLNNNEKADKYRDMLQEIPATNK